MKKSTVFFLVLLLCFLLFYEGAAAENNTSTIPNNQTQKTQETYTIGEYTITHDEAVGFFIFFVIVFLVIAMSMKTARK